jgi:hypothetical protein
MSVSIGEVSTEFVVEGQSRGGGETERPDEVRLEELRAVVRALIVEELERHRRTAVEP